MAINSQPIPVSLFEMDSINIGDSKIDYFSKAANFKDVYAPKKSSGFQIQSQRLVTVNDWKFYGNFSFTKYSEKQTGFTEMTNPYRDNPYVIADSITNAEWSKQKYVLETKIVSPEFVKNVNAGIAVKYLIDNGARQVDPRPLDKALDLKLDPFISYNNKNWITALGITYTNYREDLNISLQNSQRPKNIYKILGLGEYLYSNPIIISNSLSRIYQGNGLGFNAVIGRKLKNKGLLQASFSHIKSDEKVTDGTSNPFAAGLHKNKQQKLFLSFEKEANQKQQFASLGFLNNHSDNIEHIQSLNPVTQQYDLLYSSVMHQMDRKELDFKYQINFFKKESLNWAIGLQMLYKSLDEKYASTNSLLYTKDVTTSWFVTKFFNIKSNQLSIGWNASYKAIGSNNFKYLINTASTNFVAFNIVQPNYIFYTTPYFQNSAQIQWTFQKFSKSDAQLYIKFNYQNTKALQASNTVFDGKQNNNLMFTIGLYN